MWAFLFSFGRGVCAGGARFYTGFTRISDVYGGKERQRFL